MPLNQSNKKNGDSRRSQITQKLHEEPKTEPRKRKDHSPQNVTTAKSKKHLDTSYTASLATRQQKTGKPKTKMKSSPVAAKRLNNSRHVKNSSRSLPVRPSVQTRTRASPSRATTKQNVPTASELREVPVVQNNTPLYSSFLSASYSDNQTIQSDPDLILGLPQHYDLLSLSSRFSSSRHRHASRDQLTAGSIIDGCSTHRSVGASSVFSAVTLDNISVHQDQGSVHSSTRPLPNPPGSSLA